VTAWQVVRKPTTVRMAAWHAPDTPASRYHGFDVIVLKYESQISVTCAPRHPNRGTLGGASIARQQARAKGQGQRATGPAAAFAVGGRTVGFWPGSGATRSGPPRCGLEGMQLSRYEVIAWYEDAIDLYFSEDACCAFSQRTLKSARSFGSAPSISGFLRAPPRTLRGCSAQPMSFEATRVPYPTHPSENSPTRSACAVPSTAAFGAETDERLVLDGTSSASGASDDIRELAVLDDTAAELRLMMSERKEGWALKRVGASARYPACAYQS
jgi:hypothetical protein